MAQFTEYDRLIWELALVTPVEYFDQGPIIDQDCIPDIKHDLENYDFKVIVDGLEIRKPILFPLDETVEKKGSDFDFAPIKYKRIIKSSHGKSCLKFKGYIYFQKKAIIPPELRGILIRIRNVAIGYYDKSLLHYPLPTGPLANQVSGEIYVEEGLESALNIDRNSFRETDLHYLAIQDELFEILAGTKTKARERKKEILLEKLPVFDRIRRYSKRRRDEKRTQEEEEYLDYLENILRHTLKTTFSIEVVDEVGDRPVIISNTNTIRIYDKNPLWPRKRAERNVVRKFLIFKEISERFAESIESARTSFFELLKRSRK